MEIRGSVVVVTGASSGIGNATATFLAKKGYKVYGTCRDPASFSRKADEFFEMLPMELCDSSSIAKAADKIHAAEGRIDAVICCAGSGLLGAIEDSSVEEAQSILDVNYLGTLRTIKAFLPRMREAGKGRILIVGGLESIVAAPCQGLYSASEFALAGLTQVLRVELSSFGIDVGFLALGSFRTAFGKHRKLAGGFTEASPYRPMLESVSSMLTKDEAEGADPLIAARAVFAGLTARRLAALTTLGPAMRRFFAVARHLLPDRMFELILRKYYRIG